MAKKILYDRGSSVDLSNKSLIDIFKSLKRNSAWWAKWWVQNDTPDEPCTTEHHIITEVLLGFRKRFNEANDSEKNDLREFLTGVDKALA